MRYALAVGMLFFATTISADEVIPEKHFTWAIAPTTKLVFDPAVGLDLQGPGLGAVSGVRNRPALGIGATFFCIQECTFRFLGIGYAVDGFDSGYLTVTPIMTRLSGEPGQGWNIGPVYRYQAATEGRPAWHGFAFQISLRFSSRTDADIAPGR